ncbi:hypothetical protein SNEBB_002469 [Seison nebaliae]|nr:hypothetical protein SNEBB_002469 [Seison nebaliae]
MNDVERSPLEMLVEILNRVTTDATLRHDCELMLAESETRITYLQTLYDEEQRTTEQLRRRVQLLEYALAQERNIKLDSSSVEYMKENNTEMLQLPLKYKPFHLSNNRTAKNLMSDYLQKIKYSDELVDVHLNALNFGVKNLLVDEDMKMKPVEIEDVRKQIEEFNDHINDEEKKENSENISNDIIVEKIINEHINHLKNEKMELDDVTENILKERCEKFVVGKEKVIEEKSLPKMKECEEVTDTKTNDTPEIDLNEKEKEIEPEKEIETTKNETIIEKEEEEKDQLME